MIPDALQQLEERPVIQIYLKIFGTGSLVYAREFLPLRLLFPVTAATQLLEVGFKISLSLLWETLLGEMHVSRPVIRHLLVWTKIRSRLK